MHEPLSPTRRWLRQARITDTPQGDLILDMRADPGVPRLFPNIKAMRGYVALKCAGDSDIMAAVPGVWRRYQRWLDRNPI
jgi:hypothetical protein